MIERSIYQIINFKKYYKKIIKNTLNYILCILIHIMQVDPSFANINCNKTTDRLLSSTKNLPTFYSKNNVSSIYNQKGKQTCKLISKYIKHSHDKKSTFFVQPIIILFNKKNVPSWNIQAKEAKMTDDKIIYLYDNVQINSLIHNSYLESITTNIAVLNLNTHDIFSNEIVFIHSISFETMAKNIKGNLYTNIIELQKITYTIHETKNR